METNELHRGRLIDHIQLVVRDLEASRTFYRAVFDVLGVPMGGESDDYFWADEFGIRLAEQVQIDSAETVNGSIKAAQNLTVQGGLSTVNGSIETAAGSTIKADISTVNGSIRLSGSEVGGKLETVNGNISLLAGTVVKGDLIYAERKRQSGWFGKDDSNQPTLTISADSRVEGKIILRQPVQLKLENASLAARVVREY